MRSQEMNPLPHRIATSVLTLPEDAFAFALALVHAASIRPDVRQAIVEAIHEEVGHSPMKVAFRSEVVSA